MSRFFNTEGPCNPADHYMLPPSERLPDAERLIDRKRYFVIHAPRQAGKTTTVRALAEKLTAEGKYTALVTTCEAGQKRTEDLKGSIAALLDTLRQDALELPEELRPPPADLTVPAETRLRDLLGRWSRQSPRPLVLFLDEIDALMGEALISVLRQLRSGYPDRPNAFPHSIALVGLRDVRDYHLLARTTSDRGIVDEILGTASPFNVKARSFTLRNFTANEVAELYEQHTEETGQPWTDAAKAYAFELTGGQPWLVNAVAEQITEWDVRERTVTLDTAQVDTARETLIQRRDTHLDSLAKRLREPRVQRVLEPILAGEVLAAEVMDDDVSFTKDLGLVVSGPQGLQIANPIYREIIPRALTSIMEESIALPRPSYLRPDGGLDFEQLLEDFQAFWLGNAEVYLATAPYSEAAAQLVFFAFLHKITNGRGGTVDREFAAGRGRTDLLIRWRLTDGSVERSALELKVWRDTSPRDPVQEGTEQLASYLARLGLGHGTLLVFDSRSGQAPLPERMTRETREHEGRRIDVLLL